jgi:hypothetical protein
MNQRSLLRLPGPFAVRLVLWVALLFCFPLPASIASYSFRAEVLGQAEPAQVVFPARADGAASIEEPSLDFTDRTLARLVEAEEREPDAWFRDDYRIARVTVGAARRGSLVPHVEATYAVLGLHPDKVWPRIEAQRQFDLGSDYSAWYDENGNLRVQGSPRKPVQSERRLVSRSQRERAA